MTSPAYSTTLRVALVLAAAVALPPSVSLAQWTWTELPNAPFTGRHNDVFFVNPNSGWIVDGDGEIFHTTNSGETWDLQFQKGTAHFRTIGFVDDQRGWAGNVGNGEFGATDPNPIYETTDGGASWSPVASISGETPVGICGINIVSETIAVAVGRVRGPAFFARTDDGGQTWTGRSMSEHAAGLIDVHFFTPDSGLAVGLTNEDHEQSRGIVLATSDGGQTWTERFVTSRLGEWAWKISFPTRDVGYVSLQRNSRTPIFFLKTTDGGLTWEEKLFSSSYYFVQGIGFVSENVGWIGGNSSNPTYVTTDGGDTWASADFGSRVNRLRFISDTLGFAVGRTVYKYVGEPLGNDDDPPLVTSLHVEPGFPNPTSGDARFTVSVPQDEEVRIEIVNVLGQRVRTLLVDDLTAGEHDVTWDGRNGAGHEAAAGVYLLSVETERSRASQAIVLQR